MSDSLGRIKQFSNVNDSLEVVSSFYSKFDSISRVNLSLQDSVATLNNQELIYATETEIFGMPLNLARVFIPVIVTLLVFALGQFLIWLKSKYEKQNEVT